MKKRFLSIALTLAMVSSMAAASQILLTAKKKRVQRQKLLPIQKVTRSYLTDLLL